MLTRNHWDLLRTVRIICIPFLFLLAFTFLPNFVEAQDITTGLAPLQYIQSLAQQFVKEYVAIPSAHAQTADIVTGLIGHWKFDETSGTTASDSSGNSNTGTLTNGPTWTTGKIGGAMSFDGVNQYVNSGSNAVLDDLSSLSFSAWINPSTATYGSQGTVAQKGHGSVNLLYEGWIIAFSQSNPTRLEFRSAYSTIHLSVQAQPNTFAMNEWQYLTVTWDGSINASGVHMYRNGVEVAYITQQNASGVRVLDAARSFFLGSNSYNDTPFKGSLDDSRIYNRVLSASDIQALYALGSGAPPPPPPSGDTQTPTVPSNLSATTQSSTQINLSWTASTDNIGVTGYRVEKCQGSSCANFTQIATPTGTSYSDTGLTANTAYRYQVRATDAAGNLSGYSSIASATTQASTPPPSGNSLASLAASMVAGSWAELTTSNITAALDNLSGAAGIMSAYTDDMVWDPTSGQAFVIGADHLAPEGPQFVSYNVSTNTWQRLTRPTWLSSLTFFHGYDHSAINQASGILYHRPYGQNVVHRYAIQTQTWTTLPNPTFTNTYANCCDALEYFPEMNGLVWVRGVGEIWLFNEGAQQRSLLGSVAAGSTWQQAEYNPIHKVMVFTVGGLHYKLSSSGQITSLAAPPVALYNGSGYNGVLTVDPVSGDYLVLTPDSRALYRYNVTNDSWQTQSSTNKPTLTRQGVVATPINTYGVVLFAACTRGDCHSYLYKHAASVPPPTDTQAPSVPTNLTATAVSISQINLTWTASTDNVGVTSYRVERCLGSSCTNFAQVATPSTNSYLDTGLAANTTYRYQVRATDAAGNLSGYSSIASATTQSGGGGGTVLGNLAASMTPGTWVQLNTTNFQNGDILRPPAGGSILEYTDKAGGWNPLTQTLQILGGAHTSNGQPNCNESLYARYDATTNAWVDTVPQACPNFDNSFSSGSGHAYDHDTLNPTTGDFYHRQYASGRIMKFSHATQSWSFCTFVPSGAFEVAGVLEYFPERNSLIFIDGDWGVWELSLASGNCTGSWIQRTSTTGGGFTPQLTGLGPYHNEGRYSPTCQCIVFGGGNGSSVLYRMYSNATFSAGVAAPAPFFTPNASGGAIFTVDPVSGDILVWYAATAAMQFHRYDPVANTWNTVSNASPMFPGPEGGVTETVAIPISTYGVVMFAQAGSSGGGKVYLYKHASGGTPPPSDTTIPTASVTAPTAGTTVVNTVTISANASDNVGVTNVEFLVDGVVKGSDNSSPYTYSWDTTNGGTHACNGPHTHTLVSKAYDAAGNVGSSSGVVVNMNNPSYCTVTPPPPTGSQVTSFHLTSPTSGTLPFTVGLGFKKGDIIDTPALNIPDQQVIVKKRWNDGSVKHVVASGQTSLTANTPKTIAVLNSTASSGTNLTTANIQAANPQASVSLGSYGTVNLSSLLASPFRTWISGPEMVEAHYRSNVGSDPTLQVWFHVRLYKGGRIWIRTSVENGYLDVTTSDKTYTPIVSVGGVTVFNNGGAFMTHYAHTRWTAEGWIGGDPQITPKFDTLYLENSKLVPNYMNKTPGAAALDGLYQNYAYGQHGDWTTDMGQTGYQGQIGILALWDALFITSGSDARAYRSVIANAKALNSYALVWRDSANNLPTMPSLRPNWNFWGPETGGADIPPGGGGGLIWEKSHHGSAGYLAYLITGDYYHLETMENQASVCYLAQSTAFGGGYGINRHLLGQTRAVAWCNRTIGQLAAIAPTGDSVANDYRSLFVNNSAFWLSQSRLPGMNPLTFLYFYEIGQMTGYYANGGVPIWEYDFWTQTYGHLSDMDPVSSTDIATLTALRDAQYKQVVGRLGIGGANGYCFVNAVRYVSSIAANNNSDPTTWFTSWGQVDAATNGVTATTPCGNTLLGSSGADPAQATGGYWGNMLPAIAYAVDHGATGASAAWARLTGASNWPDVLNSGFGDTPIWGIIPRTGQSTPLPLLGDLNNDRTVNNFDWNIMAGVWFTNDPVADINQDGIVNTADYYYIYTNWGRTI